MTAPLLETPDRAFERMYEKYARIVYRYALAVMRNPSDAEDITQTTFLNAYRAMKGGEEPLKPRHWLLKIAHNACRMRWVHNSRRPQEVPLEGKVDQLVMPDQERPNVRAVLNELAKLPFNQRSAVVMRELEGRSYEEIAETLGVTVSAVETLLVRARRTMRLRRSAINVLGVVQLPASLETFFAGGAAVATGGAVVGSIAFKAAAVLVAGLVAGGAGYTAVDAATRAQPKKPERLKVVQPDAVAPAHRSFAFEPGAAAPPGATVAVRNKAPRSKPTPTAAPVGHAEAGSPGAAIGTAQPPAAVPPDDSPTGGPPAPGPPPAPPAAVPAPPVPERPVALPPAPLPTPPIVQPPPLPTLPAVPLPPQPPKLP